MSLLFGCKCVHMYHTVLGLVTISDDEYRSVFLFQSRPSSKSGFRRAPGDTFTVVLRNLAFDIMQQ